MGSGAPGSLDTTWRQRGGSFTTPANTAFVRIQLYNYMNSGWVAFDDVSLLQAAATPVVWKYYYALRHEVS